MVNVGLIIVAYRLIVNTNNCGYNKTID